MPTGPRASPGHKRNTVSGTRAELGKERILVRGQASHAAPRNDHPDAARFQRELFVAQREPSVNRQKPFGTRKKNRDRTETVGF